MNRFLHFFLPALLLCFTFSASADNADVTEVLNADFTQFTEGSPEAPVSFPSYGTGAFTSYFSGWYATKVSQAGGSILIADGGYVQTSSLSLSANGGIAKVSARVKALDSYGGAVKLSLGYATSGSATEYIYDNEWHEISVILSGGTSFSRVKLEPYLSASGILVEWLKVEQSASFIAAPTAYQPTQANGTSFTASWSSVTGTTSYYLDVYSYNATGEKVYFLQNEDCGTTRSKKVEGLDSAITYYYVVRASNGTASSEDSNEIEVVKVIASIDTPVVANATVANGKASFSWDPVENAESYIVTLYRHTTLKESTEVDLINDDFAKVTEGTLSGIEFTYDYKLDLYTNIKGWDGSELGLAAGNIVLTPFTGSTGNLITPALDLSASNGAFTVKLNLAEGAYGTFYAGGTVTVNLLDADDNVLETKDLTLSKDFADYTVKFTKGAENCRVEISYAYSGYKLFISDVAISQTLPAGSVIDEIINEDDITDTEYSFDFTAEDGVKIGYTVVAVGRTVSGGSIVEILSDASEEKFVEAGAAIGSVATDSDASFTVSVVAKGTIEVTASEAAEVTVYDFNGRVIASAFAQEGTTTINCNASGVAIVKVGPKAVKVVL